MNKILAALVSMLMILGTVAPALAASSTATVSDAPTTFSLSAIYSIETGFDSNGEFTATLVATDDNGQEDIVGGYSILWDDEAGVGHTETLIEGPDDGNPLTKTYTATGVIPYYQNYNSVISISSEGETATVTISNELSGITAGNVAFGAVIPGESADATSTITNNGNVDVNVNVLTVTTLYSSSTGDTIPAPVVTTTLPLTIEDLVLGSDEINPDDISFTLTVEPGTLAGNDYTGTVTFTLA